MDDFKHQSTVTESVHHEPRYWLIAIVGGLLIAAIVVGGMYFYFQSQSKRAVMTLETRITDLETQLSRADELRQEIIPEPTPESLNIKDELSIPGVTFYQNQEFGFAVGYPEGWVAEAPAYGGTLAGSSTRASIRLLAGFAPLSPTDAWEVVVGTTAVDTSDILIDPATHLGIDVPVRRIIPVAPAGVAGVLVVFENGDQFSLLRSGDITIVITTPTRNSGYLESFTSRFRTL